MLLNGQSTLGLLRRRSHQQLEPEAKEKVKIADDGIVTADPMPPKRKVPALGDHQAAFLLHNPTAIAHQGKSKALTAIERSSLPRSNRERKLSQRYSEP